MKKSTDNKFTHEQFRAWNEQMVKKYDPDAFHQHPNPIVRFVERRRVKTIFRLSNIHENDRIIEVGCGAGNVIERISCKRLFGVDISNFILSKAKQKLKGAAQLFQGDAQNLSCKDEVFTHVICSEVLEHLINPSFALSEMARVLMPKGAAIISIPNELWINRIKNILLKLRMFHWFLRQQGGYSEIPEKMDEEWHLHVYSLKEWLDRFEKSFKLIQIKRIPFSWFPLRYVVRLEKKE